MSWNCSRCGRGFPNCDPHTDNNGVKVCKDCHLKGIPSFEMRWLFKDDSDRPVLQYRATGVDNPWFDVPTIVTCNFLGGGNVEKE
jgi:DNA-directed RNA polymerase subunit RPC12/RpoP